MRLPTEFEQRPLQEVYTLERNVSMPYYVTFAERFGTLCLTVFPGELSMLSPCYR